MHPLLPFALGLAALAAAAHAQDAPTVVPLDGEVTVGGVGFACTGVGQTRNDPKWKTWPLRVEFSNQHRDLLTDAVVTVQDGAGRGLARVSCEGPWLLVRPSAAARTLSARIPGQAPTTQTAPVGPAGKAQRTIEFQFTGP